jgi:hypothetical protein
MGERCVLLQGYWRPLGESTQRLCGALTWEIPQSFPAAWPGNIAYELPMRIPTAKTKPPPTITCTAEDTIGMSM